MEIIDLTTKSPLRSPIPDHVQPVDESAPKSRSRRRKGKQSASAVVAEDGELLEAPSNVKTVKKPHRHRSRSRSRDRDTPAKDTRRDRRRRERDRNSPPRRRSHSPEQRHRKRDRSPSVNGAEDTPIFFVDIKPVAVSENLLPKPSTSSEPAVDLILPAHVSVVGSNVVAVEIHSPTNSDLAENEDDYINYLDYDDDRRVRLHTLAM